MTYNLSGFFTDQDDIIPGWWWELIYNDGGAYTLAGNDKIIGVAQSYEYSGKGLINYYNGIIDTGNDRDTITGAAWPYSGAPSIYNLGSIDTGDDADYISTYATVGFSENPPTYYGALDNYGTISLGEGNDVLDAMIDVTYEPALYNFGTINTGNGDDTITSNTRIYNDGVINTGNGNDALLVGYFTTYGGFDGSGDVLLEGGEDFLRGFGSGDYYGGIGQDSLQLTSGSYTLVIGGYANVSFIRSGDGTIMHTFGFEKLLTVNGSMYDFTSLYDGMTIYA